MIRHFLRIIWDIRPLQRLTAKMNFAYAYAAGSCSRSYQSISKNILGYSQINREMLYHAQVL